MGICPFNNACIFCSLTSTHVTLTPISAKHVPETRPTYPVPTIAIFIMKLIILMGFYLIDTI